MKCLSEGKAGMILYDVLCQHCEDRHWAWRYPCPKKCEDGKVTVEPLGYKICETCQGRGYIR